MHEYMLRIADIGITVKFSSGEKNLSPGDHHIVKPQNIQLYDCFKVRKFSGKPWLIHK